MTKQRDLDAMVVCTAVSLYGFNVSPTIQAQRLYDHFHGYCMEVEDMEAIFLHRRQVWATELPAQTALVYIQHAMSYYGAEATHRVLVNLGSVSPAITEPPEEP